MREVNYGWLVRYFHANGASFFFLVVYIHVFRNIFYMNFLVPKEKVWVTGVFILFLMIITAFLGYVLPWGQMSFWAATVITNLSSVIPIIGPVIVVWLWGGYAIDNATLNRFFSFHFVLPFFIILCVFLHIYFLHEVRSSSPDTLVYFTKSKISETSFYPYYIIKDLVGLQIFFFFFFFIVFFYPNLLGHSDNYILANPLVTPPHIVPEWYFLPFYAILRSVPDKLIGVLSLFFSLFVLFILPWILSNLLRGNIFSKIAIFLFWIILFVVLILGWIGQKSIDFEYLLVGRVTGALYFIYFIFFVEIVRYIVEFILTYEKYYFKRYLMSYFGITNKIRKKIEEQISYRDRILDIVFGLLPEIFTVSFAIMVRRWVLKKFKLIKNIYNWMKFRFKNVILWVKYNRAKWF